MQLRTGSTIWDLKKVNEIRALLLAAGKGTRLEPLTNEWPKCLMPIGDRPLMDYWLQILHEVGIRKVIVNLHQHAEQVEKFLLRPQFKDWVELWYEENLLGTAGTLLANRSFFIDCTILLIHADNWCQCDFSKFIEFHQNHRPKHCLITMMTFESLTPQTCGIVETDDEGVVINFHEKVSNPPGKQANGAIYLLEPEVLNWLGKNKNIIDFSNEVVPKFLGLISTWQNTNIHRDIGQISMLRLAQSDPKPEPLWDPKDKWHEEFLKLSIHDQIYSVL